MHMYTHRGMRDSYYDGAARFIVDNSKVDSHLNQLGYEDDTVRTYVNQKVKYDPHLLLI